MQFNKLKLKVSKTRITLPDFYQGAKRYGAVDKSLDLWKSLRIQDILKTSLKSSTFFSKILNAFFIFWIYLQIYEIVEISFKILRSCWDYSIYLSPFSLSSFSFDFWFEPNHDPRNPWAITPGLRRTFQIFFYFLTWEPFP